MDHLLAGAARINITPPPGIRQSGYGSRTQPSIGVHDDLWAQALVVDDGERQVAVITTDVVALPVDLVDEVRSSLESELGLPPAHVFLCAAHNHSGPELTLADGSRTPYGSELAEKLRGVTRTAMQDRRAARVWGDKGMLHGIAKNRRPAGGPMDPEVGVLSVETMQGASIAALVNYTCHATVLGADNLLVTADYPGFMRRGVERQLGPDAVVLFANGALGNINPGGYSPETSMIGAYIPHRTFADAERLGTQLADEVLRVLRRPATPARPIVNALSEHVMLPLKERPDRARAEANLARQQQLMAKLKQRGGKPQETAAAEIALAYAGLEIYLLEELERAGGRELSAEIHAVRIGNSYLVGIPGEPFVEIGLEIKRRSGLPHVQVVGLANGYLSYIPTTAAYAEGGYEPATAKFAPGADITIVDAATALLARLQQRSN